MATERSSELRRKQKISKHGQGQYSAHSKAQFRSGKRFPSLPPSPMQYFLRNFFRKSCPSGGNYFPQSQSSSPTKEIIPKMPFNGQLPCSEPCHRRISSLASQTRLQPTALLTSQRSAHLGPQGRLLSRFTPHALYFNSTCFGKLSLRTNPSFLQRGKFWSQIPQMAWPA